MKKPPLFDRVDDVLSREGLNAHEKLVALRAISAMQAHLVEHQDQELATDISASDR
ncbi:MAG: hypothetical protein K2Y71_29220 [Xanthobacteraceae bacterium]|nr:hypothetical protein [Xanthobacteraceae bacterium]